jgi:hypothetical protein
MCHETCRDIFVRTSIDELDFPATTFFCGSSQEERSALNGRIAFEDSNKAEKGCYGACGDEVVAASMADTGERVIFDVESDDSSTISVGAGKRSLEAMSMGCNFEALLS